MGFPHSDRACRCCLFEAIKALTMQVAASIGQFNKQISMTDWISYPITLKGQTVDLLSLDKKHFEELETLAKDKRIWEFYPFDGSDPNTFLNIFNTAIIEREKGTQLPFVIFHKPENKIIGSTRFLDIQPKHKKLEIGSTWLHPDYWATEVNLECKLLLLTYCFENLKTVRVQLKTDQNNLRSRKAIEKIGGQFEGILRNDMIRDNNTKRNSAYRINQIGRKVKIDDR